VAILWTFAIPHFGWLWFGRIESSFSRFDQHRALSVVAGQDPGHCRAVCEEVKIEIPV
jgi:hypothetical protein